MLTSGVAAWHVWCGSPATRKIGAEPYISYSNNTSEDTSVFVPGQLLETGIDIGSSERQLAFRLAYKRALDSHLLLQPASGHAFTYGLIYGDNVMWRRLAKLDSCVPKDQK